jgi:hypothetical protein
MTSWTEILVYPACDWLTSIDAQLKALEDEQITIHFLIDQAKLEIIDIAKTWHESGIRQKQEIQTMLWPEG